MKVNHGVRCNLLVLLAASAWLCGCFSRSQPTKFYLLQTIPTLRAGKGVEAKEDLKIGVGPITLPEYLDRPQIVTRINDNEFQIDEFNQWAETLGFSIERVLAKNLSILLFTNDLFIYPWLGSTQIDYQVKVDVVHFNGIPGNKVVLETQYTILDGSKEFLKMNLVNISQPISEQGYEGLVSSMSKALDELSRTIAQTITALQREKTQLK